MGGSVKGMLYLPSLAHVRREVLKAQVEEFINRDHGRKDGKFCDVDSDPDCVGGIGKDGFETTADGQKAVNGITHIGKTPIAEWCVNHGISPSAMRGRGYGKWQKTGDTPDGELDPAITEAYGTSKAAMTQMRNAASQSSGIIMPRHAVPGSPVDKKNPILPQTRPDAPVLAAAEVSNLRRDGISLDDLDADPNLKDRVINGYKNEKGEMVPGLGAKYLFPAGKGNAARVDLPPGADGENARRFLEGKGPVYLAMEGSIKTDAVLTAIEAGQGGEGASVIGVPSVTLWHTREMDWVAGQFLQGREVILIPDADGVTNRNVRNQARALQNLLELSGAGKVRVAAPPLGPPTKDSPDGSIIEVDLPGGGHEKLKGVDDYLGAGKGDLAGLDSVDRVAPVIDLGKHKQLAKDAQLGNPEVWENLRGDAKHSAEDTLRAVSLLANPATGELRAGVRTIAAAIGGSPDTAANALDRLVSLGLLKKENISEMSKPRKQELIDRDILDAVPGAPSYYWGGRKITRKAGESPTLDVKDGGGNTTEDNDFIVNEERNIETPVYTIVDKRFRSVDVPVAPIGKLGTGPTGKKVSSAAGAAFYGVPEGTPLTPEIISKAIANARSGGE